jgi:hypothetical protein
VLQNVRHHLRAFVGQTAFEALCQQWVQRARHTGGLPFTPAAIGAHWSRSVQVDVVAVNWQTHDLLLGECKWTGTTLDREIVRDLIQVKTPKVLKDMAVEPSTWRVHHIFFSRAGFTEAARAEAAQARALLVDLAQLDRDLHAPD